MARRAGSRKSSRARQAKVRVGLLAKRSGRAWQVTPAWVTGDGNLARGQAQFLSGSITAAFRGAIGVGRRAVLAGMPAKTDAQACTRVIHVGTQDYHRSTAAGAARCLYPCGW